MKKYVILILVLCVLCRVLITRIIDIKINRVCPLVPTSEEISKKEANVFLSQWNEYVSKGYIDKVPEDFLHDTTKPTDRLPFIVKLWFDKNCINPHRFYYVEQRLRAILKAYDLQKHGQAVIDILRTQIRSDMSQEEKKWYEGLIEEQKHLAKVEGVSMDELQIVSDRAEQIKEILQ